MSHFVVVCFQYCRSTTSSSSSQAYKSADSIKLWLYHYPGRVRGKDKGSTLYILYICLRPYLYPYPNSTLYTLYIYIPSLRSPLHLPLPKSETSANTKNPFSMSIMIILRSVRRFLLYACWLIFNELSCEITVYRQREKNAHLRPADACKMVCVICALHYNLVYLDLISNFLFNAYWRVTSRLTLHNSYFDVRL